MDRKKNYLDKIKRFCLMDDTFMSAVLDKDCELTEFVLRIILNKDDLRVLDVKTQYELKNLHGKSARLDVLATDSSGKEYNIEVQRAKDGGTVRRARYYSGLLDAYTLDIGENHDNLVDTYVIFIAEKDILGYGFPIYTIERKIRENGQPFGDGSFILYVNNAIQDNTPLGKLMHDFTKSNPDDILNKELSDKVRHFKEDEKGVSDMCELMEELLKEETAEARAEGKAEAQIDIAKRMLEDGIPIDSVIRISKLPAVQVEKLAASL